MTNHNLLSLTKREWDALGSLLLPVALGGKITLGKKIGRKLESLELIERFEQILPSAPGNPPVKIKGYRLTIQGHLLYCEWASTQGGCDE